MQMKYLSLALTAALATTLAACGGSDNKSNYNKDTLTPVNPTPTGTPTPTPTGTPTPTPTGTPTPTPTPTGTPTPTPTPTPPKGSDIKNNVGDAANPGNVTTDNVVVAQNYRRGDASSFDKSNNKDQVGNATVLGFNQLNNTYMSNVVVSRVLQPGETDKYTTLYLGQEPRDAGKVTWYKDDNSTKVTPAQYNPVFTSIKQYDNKNFKFDNSISTTELAEVTPSSDVAGSLENGTILAPALQNDGENVTKINASNTLFADGTLADVGEKAYKSGIVTIKSAGQAYNQDVLGAENNNLTDSDFVVRGQEDQIWTLDGNGDVTIIHETGADNTKDKDRTRIFGTLSSERDVPSHLWNGKKFVKNDYHKLWEEVKVSDYQHVAQNGERADIVYNPDIAIEKMKSNQTPPIDKNNFNAYESQDAVFDQFKNSYALTSGIVEKRIGKLQKAELTSGGWFAPPGTTGNTKVLDKNSPTPFYKTKFSAKNEIKDLATVQQALISKVLNPHKIHLNFAQYGRVSSKIDDLTGIQAAIDKKLPYSQLVGFNKYRLQDGLAPNDQNPNTIVDFYYARGLQPTTNMPKTGKYQYLGHALTYGLDNSFHGGATPLDSNSLIDIARSGTGNYVAAELDAADKSVKGKIYNVWTVADNDINLGAIEDVLISFGGKLNDTTNSVIGEAYRPYVAKDTKASFKGAFFGPNAEEFAGNINTVEEGYGDAKWGAVFGAQRPKEATTISFENAVEKEQN